MDWKCTFFNNYICPILLNIDVLELKQKKKGRWVLEPSFGSKSKKKRRTGGIYMISHNISLYNA
jgi:hypothetical protein